MHELPDIQTITPDLWLSDENGFKDKLLRFSNWAQVCILIIKRKLIPKPIFLYEKLDQIT